MTIRNLEIMSTTQGKLSRRKNVQIWAIEFTTISAQFIRILKKYLVRRKMTLRFYFLQSGFFNASKVRLLQEKYPSALVISSDVYTSLSLNTDFSDDNLPSFDDLLAINNRLNKRKDITELIVNSEYFREQ
jgi:hypothetical protein